MELKLPYNFEIIYIPRSNCTFMELKFPDMSFIAYWNGGSNCTFMELKCISSSLTLLSGSSNCTFMELK